MEYSKEDLMEAKKQIWGVGENMGTEESKKIWEENAQFWDNAMGDESNEFHREVVRPKVTELLSPNPADYILDIACGNGNYSSYLAQRGASVVAFDYSKKMIELAKRRQSQYAKQIEFCVADATDRKSILELKRNRAFTKAVSNMAIMDITDIEPLLMAVYELLQESGIFVFATQHPCFVTLTEKYMTPHSYYDIAIEGQPKEQIYYHRSIQDIFNLCFRAGFVIDGFYEECFKTNKEIPMVMIVRLNLVNWHRGVCLSMTSAAGFARRSQAHAAKRQQEQRGKPNRKARRCGAVPAKPLGIGCRFSAVRSFLLIGFAVSFTS